MSVMFSDLYNQVVDSERLLDLKNVPMNFYLLYLNLTFYFTVNRYIIKLMALVQQYWQ
jgi:hypothetical protein